MNHKLKERYQYVFEEALLEEIDTIGQYKIIEKDFPMMDIGNKITHMPLILEGAIRIMGEDDKENELLLYYLEIGDSCAMTMTCCMGGKKSNIRAITEKKTELILIPVYKMEEWIIKYKSWRVFVFESYDIRLKEMLGAIDALAFHNMEERLYKYLREKAMVLGTSELEITHYQVANDMNTSRVVISRLMKKLALDNKIISNRNHITIKEFLPK
ncbi:MAG: CRP/FNR family transcriptional regulator [Maribacter sp.]|jgi:CRP/FNR family transcriptional regulator